MKFYISDENKLKFIYMCKNQLISIKVHYNSVYTLFQINFFTYFSYIRRFFLVYKYVKQYKDSRFYDYMWASFNYKLNKLTISNNIVNTRV